MLPMPSVDAVAVDLRAIAEMSAALPGQAAHRPSARDYPGGSAMTALGPIASLEAWENQIDAAEQQHFGWCTSASHGSCVVSPHVSDQAEPTPTQILYWWSERWRVEYDRSLDFSPTVHSEVNFLRQVLEAKSSSDEWAGFARDVRTARCRLEDVLYAGKREERTRVPCIDCEHPPRLVKRFGWQVLQDHYVCLKCKRRYNPEEYRRAKAQYLASEGAARWVTVQDATVAIGRPPRTVRDWRAAGKVRSMCHRLTHQVYLWWPDVRESDLDSRRVGVR